MEKWIKKLFSDDLLEVILQKYEIKKENCKSLNGFESFVFEVQKNDKKFILKVSHEHRKSFDEIYGEAHYLNFLKENGFNVSAVIPLSKNELIGRFPVYENGILDERGAFTSALYEYAPGERVSRDDIGSELFVRMGQYLGKMHRITKLYNPSKKYRKTVLDSSVHEFEFIPKDEVIVRENITKLMSKIELFKQKDINFGLCHIDFHYGNFFYENGNIHLFDFDDAVYSWFVHDIAIMLFYILPHHCDSDEKIKFGRDALVHILKGYRYENDISKSDLEKIPAFLKLREFELYSVIHRSFDLENLDPWCKSFMTGRKEKLENEISYLDIDFLSL